MDGFYISEMVFQRSDQRIRQDGDSILLTFPISHYNLPIIKINILDTQPQAFRQPQAGPIGEAQYQPVGSLRASQNFTDFASEEHDREMQGPAWPLNIVNPPGRLLEDAQVELGDDRSK